MKRKRRSTGNSVRGLARCARLASCALFGCAPGGLGFEGGAPAVARDPEPLLSGVRQLSFAGRRSGEGYFGANGRRLVFQSERTPGNPFFQIYLMDLATGATRRLSPGVGKTTCAWLHPSGDRVLFASTHLDPAALAEQERELAARAAGSQRRYAWDYDEHYDLFAADLASGTLTRLTAARGYDAEGSYSPDGRAVVFASNRHAWAEALAPEDRSLFERDPASMVEIYRMDADGAKLRRLTRTRGYDGGPFFSPDGARIVWRRFSEDGRRAEIFNMRGDGGDERQITRLGALSWAPFYHPSGAYLIFSTNLHGHGNFELYLVDSGGERSPVRVTESDGFDGLPAFSPDGAQLAWTSGRTPSGDSQLFLATWDHEAALRALEGRPLRAARSAAPAGPPAAARTDPAIRAADLRRHVEALASEAMEGRRTGTEGERRATAYVADAFAELGLEPAGDDGSYYQAFGFTAGVSLGESNRLRAMGDGGGSRDTTVDRDWRPLAFSRVGESGPAPVAFAGYGIVAPASERFPAYDAYGELDVRNRWVIIFRYLPEDMPAERRQHLSRYASLRHKVMVARDRGALGAVVVSGPRSRVREPLVPLRADAAVAATSLFAISVSDALASDLLAPAGRDLGALQEALDAGEPLPGFEIPGLRLDARVDLLQERRTGRNALARLRAAGGDGAAPVVIGAHVDHLGRGRAGDSLAREGERERVHPGADDNASGVAALLEIAEQLAADAGNAPPVRDVIFAAWSGEEMGLLGSEAFAARLADPHDAAPGAPRAVAAYLNMDMVGRLREQLVLQGVGSSPLWREEIERRNAPIGLPIAALDDSYLPTDTNAFYLKGIPILNAFTGGHEDYHSPRDRPERIEYRGLERIARLMASLTGALAARAEPPELVVLERPQRLAPRAGLRATLGTVPSYTEGGAAGVRLSGVTAGGPGEAAGLRAGDRVVELAGRRIENIYDYTYAIDALAIGEPVQVVVERDGARIALEITPASRE